MLLNRDITRAGPEKPNRRGLLILKLKSPTALLPRTASCVEDLAILLKTIQNYQVNAVFGKKNDRVIIFIQIRLIIQAIYLI